VLQALPAGERKDRERLGPSLNVERRSVRLRAASSDPCRGFPASTRRRRPPPGPARGGKGLHRECRALAPPGGVSAPRGGGVVGKREGARPGEGEKEAPACNLRAGGGWLRGN
jgi:hypothetical protein